MSKLKRAKDTYLNQVLYRDGLEGECVEVLVEDGGDVFLYIEWEDGTAEDMEEEEACCLLMDADGPPSKRSRPAARKPRARKGEVKTCEVIEVEGFNQVRGLDATRP